MATDTNISNYKYNKSQQHSVAELAALNSTNPHQLSLLFIRTTAKV
ncbi:hypothetical protein [Neptunomonas japonica]|nr:hypothetical protein [Neptunomonas japonica]